VKKFFRSFYGKLSVIFLLLLLVMAGAQIWITMWSSRQFIREVDQKLNLDLAADMARELKPLVQVDTVNFQRIGERIHYMMVMNPKVEIYLLNREGEILSFYAEPGKKVKADQVDLGPIRRFLAGNRDIPILGDDPRHPGRKKPFSAATLQIGKGRQGYIYIIIGGEQYDVATALSRDSYILQATFRGLMVTLILAGIIGLLLFYWLTRRLRKMTGTVTRFREGNLDQRVQDDSDDEIGQLADSFNQMADTIAAQVEELQRTDQLRRELIANVSHDLRSPLASMRGYLETIMMKEDSLDVEEKQEYLEIILQNTELLHELVYGLFELSKLDARQVEPNPEPFSIAELVQDVVMKFRQKAEEQNIEINTVYPDEQPWVRADIGMIERVLSNLLDNALDYTPEGGGVAVRLGSSEGDARVEVADNGPGIPEDDLVYIFDRFFRGNKSRSESDSTGLGLAISQKLIQLHDSEIQVNSTVGEGTTFYFDLPLVEGDRGEG